MENPLRYDAIAFGNPSISSTYNKNALKLVESMRWEEGDIVMDYGCGAGRFLADFLFPNITTKVNPRCICGVDNSQQMIRFAHEKCKNKENIYFSIGDIMDKYKWTFKENMVNKFVAYLVLCYVHDYQSFFHKVYDFLRPHGQVGMLVPFSKAYGIPYQLLSQEKWAKFSEKNELLKQSSFAPWTYSDEIDAPSAIKDSLTASGFRIDQFVVEEMTLEFTSLREFCEFLCLLTSALRIVPEKLEDEFIHEMMELTRNNLLEDGFSLSTNDQGLVSVGWKFLNFVATKI